MSYNYSKTAERLSGWLESHPDSPDYNDVESLLNEALDAWNAPEGGAIPALMEACALTGIEPVSAQRDDDDTPTMRRRVIVAAIGAAVIIGGAIVFGGLKWAAAIILGGAIGAAVIAAGYSWRRLV